MKKLAQIRIAGPDKKGIIARTTGFLFENDCNIEDIDQRILDGYLTMTMVVDVSTPYKRFGATHLDAAHLDAFQAALQKRAEEIGVSVEFRLEKEKRIKNMVMLVTNEDHCARALLEKFSRSHARGRFSLMIGNSGALKQLAKTRKIPFHYIPSDNRKRHEQEILTLLAKHDVDLIVLARYMQILSPDFVFRYEGRIINIHPSLLPAFPGPRAYHQAHNKGVDVIGATAHFVTTDLDEGPIICQESARVDRNRETVDDYSRKGRGLEMKALTKAVDLFVHDRLFLRRGKVLDSKKLHKLQQQTKAFYESA